MIKTYQSRILSEFGESSLLNLTLQNYRRRLLELIEAKENPAFEKISIFVPRILFFIRNIQSLQFIRFILTRLFYFDPLSGEKGENFNLAIMTTLKDIEVLPYSLYSAYIQHKDNIENIFVIVPESELSEVKAHISRLTKTLKIKFVTDEEVQNNVLKLNSYNFKSTVAKMEFLKLSLPVALISENLLIVDGDTIYLRKRVWKRENKVTLVVSQEYMNEHINFSRNYFSLRAKSGLGFVTHHSLFIRSEIARMVEDSGGFIQLARVLDAEVASGFYSGVFPSEWQSYGDWILESEATDPVFAKFCNLGLSRKAVPLIKSPTINQIESLISRINKCVPKLGSLSLHDYK